MHGYQDASYANNHPCMARYIMPKTLVKSSNLFCTLHFSGLFFRTPSPPFPIPRPSLFILHASKMTSYELMNVWPLTHMHFVCQVPLILIWRPSSCYLKSCFLCCAFSCVLEITNRRGKLWHRFYTWTSHFYTYRRWSYKKHRSRRV